MSPLQPKTIHHPPSSPAKEFPTSPSQSRQSPLKQDLSNEIQECDFIPLEKPFDEDSSASKTYEKALDVDMPSTFHDKSKRTGNASAGCEHGYTEIRRPWPKRDIDGHEKVKTMGYQGWEAEHPADGPYHGLDGVKDCQGNTSGK